MSRKQEKAKQREAERERKQKRIENKKQEDDAEWIKQIQEHDETRRRDMDTSQLAVLRGVTAAGGAFKSI